MNSSSDDVGRTLLEESTDHIDRTSLGDNNFGIKGEEEAEAEAEAEGEGEGEAEGEEEAEAEGEAEGEEEAEESYRERTNATDSTSIKRAETLTNKCNLNFLFVGHQNRTKGYLIDILNGLLPQNLRLNTKIRFSNCSILKLILNPLDEDIEIFLNLVYTGDVVGNKRGKQYWVSPAEKVTGQFTSVDFIPIHTTVKYSDFESAFKYKTTISKPFIIYFLRHGYSEHNVPGSKNINTNTNLASNGMSNGINQSHTAGLRFRDILDKTDSKLTAVCVSDLIRTHQTLSYFLSALNGLYENKQPTLNNTYFNTPHQVIVLPCFHEISQGYKDGQLMPTGLGIANGLSRIGTLGQTQGLFARENNTNCRDDEDFNKKRLSRFLPNNTTHRKDCSKIYVFDQYIRNTNIDSNTPYIKVDWTYYKRFYNGNYRDQTSNEPCKNVTFLGFFIQDVLPRFESASPSGGKTRKTRKTKKTRKIRKTKKTRKIRKTKKTRKTKKRL